MSVATVATPRTRPALSPATPAPATPSTSTAALTSTSGPRARDSYRGGAESVRGFVAARSGGDGASAGSGLRADLLADVAARRAVFNTNGGGGTAVEPEATPPASADATYAPGGRDCDMSAGASRRARALNAGAAGNRPVSIDTREGARELIARTPQVDSVGTTRTDDFRCGGAATFNAMLLDGNHAANAGALRRVAARTHTAIDADTERALTAWEGGRSLTPNQAARLQDLTYRTGRDMPDVRLADGTVQRMDSAGLNALGMTTLTRSLRAEGAFANSRSVEMFNQDGHWTSVVTHRDGSASFANSWPDRDGRATAGEGRGDDARGPDGGANGRFRARVLMQNQDGGRVYYEARTFPGEVAPGAALPARYEQWSLSEDRTRVGAPALDLSAFGVQDRSTTSGATIGPRRDSGVTVIAP